MDSPSVWKSMLSLCCICKAYGVCPHIFRGHPNILGSIQTYGASKHTEGCPNMGDPNIEGVIQTYRQPSKHMGASKHTGSHPNIWGHLNIQGVHPNIWASKHTGGCPNMGGSKHRGGYPNIQGVHPNKWGASKHMGGAQTYGGIKSYKLHPNIWRVSKHTGSHPNIWGHLNIQWVHPNIWGHPNIQGASKYMGVYKCMGHMDTPLVWQSMLSLCCICTAGIQTSSKHTGGIQTYGGVQTWGVSKHTWGHPKILGHPNVLGHMDTPLVWQRMLSLCCVCTGGIQTSSKHTRDIQTYVGCPNICRAFKHTGGIPACLPILQNRFCH